VSICTESTRYPREAVLQVVIAVGLFAGQRVNLLERYDYPEYDDRMMQIVAKACDGKHADVRNLLQQGQSYDASHMQADGQRKKPQELEALYTLLAPAPKKTVILVDDVLTTGAHFVAAQSVIRTAFPDRKVLGIFMARRVPTNPFEDFDAL